MDTENGAFVREGIANLHDVFLNSSVLRDRMRAWRAAFSAVLFHGESPFREPVISDQSPVGTLKASTGKGHYPYAVAVLSRRGDKLFLEPDCPSIIVQ
jgi:hypothetical protein